MNNLITNGVWPVVMTPFAGADRVDWDAYDQLIDWYIEQGCHGLFASCLSSESLSMSAKNRITLVERAVARSAGRVPVVGGLMGCRSNEERIMMAKAMADGGSVAAVIPLGEVVQADASDAVWIETMQSFLEQVPDLSLGLYECPVPNHRMLTTQLTEFVVSAERFCFLKETSCDPAEQSRKRDAGLAVGFKVFNAHAGTTLDSYQRGLHGYCGLQSNLWPDLHVKMFECRESHPEVAVRIQGFCEEYNWALARSYPASAKAFVGRRLGIKFPLLSFLNNAEVTAKDYDWLDQLYDDYTAFADTVNSALKASTVA
ncbi:dihydrodipicolinate synthase family protein [Coraliomargarita sp. SDUM461004]|uniref:Dihydrodipicolinate synthase family protein n=1 Tax=Thalassobacterium sedimentorum TaxID=3041258 RepID=A0ABU1AG38_9BACT|nr:dihydrodipicolinate synthase family protein [Coraliomargarita sp. SDUM461004]MDQ8193782.1 dihydrodipicolinate synthase family protein [Coraliomargarita sp. SDUM461004]